MKLQTYNKDNAPTTNGTHKVGSLNNITYSELVEILGEPTFDEPTWDEKTQVEWIVEYNNVLYTLYDWKTFDDEYTKNELTVWSIGGKTDPTELIEYIYKLNTITKR